MSRKWLTIIILSIGLMIFFYSQAVPAHAQEPTPRQDLTSENDANCVACHTHQYYLYDSGKWFCLCDAPMHCVYCHNGRTDTNQKELAHEGLILYPTHDNALRCQSCHPEDYTARVVTFASVAGISSTPHALATATPFESVAAVTDITPGPLYSRLSRLETWRQIALGILVILMVGMLLFSYRCWKVDCLAKNQP